jgi:hypothetical protein
MRQRHLAYFISDTADLLTVRLHGFNSWTEGVVIQLVD